MGIDEIYREHGTAMRRFAARHDAVAAEDAVHTAFANTLSLEGLQNVSASYVWVALQNTLRNLRRQSMRRDSFHCAVESIDLIADSDPDIERRVGAREELAFLMQAVLSLPPRRREVFIACRLKHLSYAEAAAELGISRNTVITQMVAAMSSLDAAMQTTR